MSEENGKWIARYQVLPNKEKQVILPDGKEVPFGELDLPVEEMARLYYAMAVAITFSDTLVKLKGQQNLHFLLHRIDVYVATVVRNNLDNNPAFQLNVLVQLSGDDAELFAEAICRRAIGRCPLLHHLENNPTALKVAYRYGEEEEVHNLFLS